MTTSETTAKNTNKNQNQLNRPVFFKFFVYSESSTKSGRPLSCEVRCAFSRKSAVILSCNWLRFPLSCTNIPT